MARALIRAWIKTESVKKGFEEFCSDRNLGIIEGDDLRTMTLSQLNKLKRSLSNFSIHQAFLSPNLSSSLIYRLSRAS
jgi:hypothetical protein